MHIKYIYIHTHFVYLIFRAVLGSKAKLNNTEFPHTCTHIGISHHCPIISISHQNGTFVTVDEPALTRHYYAMSVV